MSWIYLIIAGLFEVGWAVGLKYSDGFTNFWPSVFTLFSMVISFVLLSFSLKYIPLGTAYAAWTGIGVAGTVLFGIYLFNEPATIAKFLCISLIFIGIVGLNLIQE